MADGKIFHVIEDFQFHYCYMPLQYLLHGLYNICYSAAKTKEIIKKNPNLSLHSGCKCKLKSIPFIKYKIVIRESIKLYKIMYKTAWCQNQNIHFFAEAIFIYVTEKFLPEKFKVSFQH